MSNDDHYQPLKKRRYVRKLRGRTRSEPYAAVTPKMHPVWRVILFWVVIAALVATAIYWAFTSIPGLLGPDDSGLDAIQVVLGIMAGIGAIFLGVYAYRRQRLQEVASYRDDQSQFLARYNAATEQLADDKAAARLAGVYAMARLADDWPAQRQQCVDVLCAYLRMSPEPHHGDIDVRATIVRVITDHLRATNTETSWSGLDFNFDRAHFHDLDMKDVVFNGRYVTFQDAEFYGSTSFKGAKFNTTLRYTHANFNGLGADFRSASFRGEHTSFHNVAFKSGWLSFRCAHFAADVTSFSTVIFSSASIDMAQSKFEGAITSFEGAIFHSGPNFFQTDFSSDTLTFDEALFSGENAEFTEVAFRTKSTSFNGTVIENCKLNFDGATANEALPFTGPEELLLMWERRATQPQPVPPFTD